MTEHYRPNGLGQGYFCNLCGAEGLNMYGTGHGLGECFPNRILVDEIRKLNTQEADMKREFISRLKYGKK